MSTSTPSFKVSNSSTADFRGWGAGVRTALSAFGLVRTADTGQIDWTTVSAPASNTMGGYEIWRFDDSLQATAPVFFRMEYGSSSAGSPMVTIQSGTGSDGAGNLTGTLGTRLGAHTYYNGSGAVTQYFSGDTNRFVFNLRYTTASNSAMTIWIERLRGSDGVDSSAGVFYGAMGYGWNSQVATWSSVAVWGGTRVVEFAHSVQPPPMCGGMNICLLSGNGVGTYAQTTNAPDANNIYLIPVIPTGWTTYSPSLQVWAYYNGDITSMVQFSSTIYGTSRTMLPLGAELPSTSPLLLANNSNVKIAMALW